jgi:hypothetical protein
MRKLALAVALVAGLTMLAPVAAADQANWTVESRHTDFGTGDESDYPTDTTNLTATNPGSDAASLSLSADDSFEAQPADAGLPHGWGGSSGAEVSATRASAGDHSLQLDGGGDFAEKAIPGKTANVTVDLYASSASNSESRVILTEGGQRIVMVAIRNDELQYFDGSWNTVAVGSGLAEQWVEIAIHDIDPASDTYGLSYVAADGTSGSLSNVDMENPATDGYDNVRAQEFGDGGYWDDLQVAAQPTSASYSGDLHSVDNAQAAAVNLTLQNAEADVSIETSAGGTITSQTFTASGNKTLTVPGTNSNYRVQVDFSATGSNPTAELNDESILVDPRAPTVSNLQPDQTSSAQGSPLELSADVRDYDFQRDAGDRITAEWYIDGTKRGETTVTSNGTTTFEPDGVTGGAHEWSVEVADSYGETATSPTAEFLVPGELRVYNESEPTQLVDGTGTLRVRFYEAGEDDVYERGIENGTVDMSGLPVDKEFVVTVEDTAGAFAYRRIIVDSVLEQNEIYLLPTDVPSVDVEFRLDDQTGQFSPPSNVDLFVERALNKDFDGDGTNETRYQVILGDNFGSAGSFPAVLAPNERYRLRVRNDDGETRVLGGYTVADGGVQPVTIGQIVVSGDTEQGTTVGATVAETNGDRVLRIQYRDPNGRTDSLDVQVNLSDGTVIRPNTTETGPYGVYTETIDINDTAGQTYVVRYHAERSGGPDVGGTVYAGEVRGPGGLGLSEDVATLLSYVAITSVAGLVVIVDDRLAAMTTVAFATGLDTLGTIDIPAVALGVAGAIAVIYAIGRSTG